MSGSTAIFGGAKPVDTAARERQIEEKLHMKKQVSASEKENRSISAAVIYTGHMKHFLICCTRMHIGLLYAAGCLEAGWNHYH